MDKQILVVEDDVEINELLGEYLTLEGLAPVSALDGKTALQLANITTLDAVVLDLMLPDVDGYEVCKQLASHRKTATVPVVILTCMNQECDRVKGLVSGAFRYMNKPFLPDDLITQIKAAFEWKTLAARRAPIGTIALSSKKSDASFYALNDMIVDIFNHTDLPDLAVVGIREGFRVFFDWLGTWAASAHRNVNLVVQYRLCMANGDMANHKPADTIEWIITEQEPGILAQALFQPLPTAAVLATNAGSKAVELTSGNPLTSWYQFLAKIGVARFDKDTPNNRVRLQRHIHSDAAESCSVPVVTIDGTRMPTRLRSEAMAGKPK